MIWWGGVCSTSICRTGAEYLELLSLWEFCFRSCCRSRRVWCNAVWVLTGGACASHGVFRSRGSATEVRMNICLNVSKNIGQNWRKIRNKAVYWTFSSFIVMETLLFRSLTRESVFNTYDELWDCNFLGTRAHWNSLCAKGWLYLLTLQKGGQNSSWRDWGVVLPRAQTSAAHPSAGLCRGRALTASLALLQAYRSCRARRESELRVYSHKAQPQAPSWNSSPSKSNENQQYKSKLPCGALPEAAHKVLRMMYGARIAFDPSTLPLFVFGSLS